MNLQQSENSNQCNNKIYRKEDFKIAEYSLHGEADRFHFAQPNNQISDIHCSVYFHTEEIKEYKKQNGRLSGYKGIVYAPHLLVRTSPKLELRDALNSIRNLALSLENKFELDHRYIRYFFDGEESFYLILREELFGGFTPGKELPVIHSIIKSRLTEGMNQYFDFSIYNHIKLIPMPGTLRSKTKLYCTELTPDEVFSLDIEGIKKLCKTRRNQPEGIIPSSELSTIDELVSLKEEAETKYAKLGEFLTMLYDNNGSNFCEIRKINGKYTNTYFKNNSDDIIKLTQGLNGQGNLYYGLATRKDNTSGRKDNLAYLNVLYADIDYGTEGHNGKAAYSSKEEAEKAIASFKLKPTCIVFSGHGYQVIWKLKTSITLDKESISKAESMMKKLNTMIGGDKTQNADRVFRMPFTLNMKDEIPVEAVIEDMDLSLVYDLQDFEEWIGAEIKQERSIDKTDGMENQDSLLPIESFEAVKNKCEIVKSIYTQAEEGNVAHPDRYNIATLLLRFDGGKEEIHNLLGKCGNYDKEKTDAQLKQMEANGYKPTLCSSLCQVKCANMEKLGKNSPIAFAYRTAKKAALQNTDALFEGQVPIEKIVIRLLNIGLRGKDCMDALALIIEIKLPENEREEAINKAKEEYKKYLSLSGPFWDIELDKGISVKIDVVKLVEFLQKEGFFKKYIERTPILIRSISNVASEVSLEMIRDFTIEWINGIELADDYKNKIKDELFSRSGYYFGEKLISCINTKEVSFKRDDPDKAYFYFKNGFITVSKYEGIRFNEYSELSGIIWRSQVLPHDINLSLGAESDFKKFIWNVMKNDPDRVRSLESAVGYLLHDYKKSSLAKAVVFCDEKISDNPNGRTGKSLISRAVSKLKESTRLDGKNFDFESSFAFQQVDLSTRIMEFNDVNRKFDFERLFSIITDAITVNKKGRAAFSIPFESSPKILISTNYTIKGSSDSFRARLFEIEFSDHYSAKHQPKDEFNKLFFEEWSVEEWNGFYNYMISCSLLYMSEGLIEPKAINLDRRKLIDQTCKDFAEFASVEILNDNDYVKKAMVDKYNQGNSFFGIASNTFTKWLKSLAEIRGYEYTERKSDGKKFFRIISDKQ